MRHPVLAHTIEEIQRYVAACADPASSESANLVYSAKYLSKKYGMWDAYLYANLLLHDILDSLKQGKIEFKYLSEEEQRDLSKEFKRGVSALADSLDEIYEDWGGQERMKLEQSREEVGSFFGAPAHVPERKAARTFSLIKK